MHLSDNATLRALVWMVACGVLFGILNMLQKLLTHQLHPPQVMCLRYLVGLLSAAALRHRRPAGEQLPAAPAPRCMPGVSMLAGHGLADLDLDDPGRQPGRASAIGFTGPIFMMLGASLFLGERMYGARWAAVLIAFGGVLMVLWPGLVQSDVAVLPTVWMLVASPLFAVSFLLSKVLTRYDRPEAIVFWLGVMIFSFGLPFAVFALEWPLRVAWQWPTALQWIIVGACGLAGSSAHYCDDAGLSHRGRLGRAVRALP